MACGSRAITTDGAVPATDGDLDQRVEILYPTVDEAEPEPEPEVESQTEVEPETEPEPEQG